MSLCELGCLKGILGYEDAQGPFPSGRLQYTLTDALETTNITISLAVL